MVLLLLVIGAVLSVCFVVAGTAIGRALSRDAGGGPVPSGSAGMGRPIVTGDKNSKTTVSIWEDFQCPGCRDFEMSSAGIVVQASKQKTARVEYNLAAFLGPESERAANAAACVADVSSDWFEYYHYVLFTRQPPEGSGGFTNDELVKMAKEMKMPSRTRFSVCVERGLYVPWVRSMTAEMQRQGIGGTPTVVLNGQRLPQVPSGDELIADLGVDMKNQK